MSDNKKFFKQLKLGSVTLSSNILCAPLAGCSDFPFRKMTSPFRPALIYCEMVKIDALIRHDPHTYRLLDYETDMHPIGAQLCGSKAHMAAPAARIIEDLGFDVVDFNCGCPVDKVTKDGSGSGMLKNPELIGEMIANMVAAVKIPVTVKIRTGWDEKHINAPEITAIAEKAGAKAICIHGRTREQGYSGHANWDHIRACKEVAKNIQVIGNGDVFDAASALKMFETTGCDAILLSRGTMGQPWIIEDIYRALEGLPPIERTQEHYHRAFIEHFHHIAAYQSQRRALLDLRRISCWYFKKEHGAKNMRETFQKFQSLQEVQEWIPTLAV